MTDALFHALARVAIAADLRRGGITGPLDEDLIESAAGIVVEQFEAGKVVPNFAAAVREVGVRRREKLAVVDVEVP